MNQGPNLPVHIATAFTLEMNFLQSLINLPLDSISDDGQVQMKCHNIGQEIFDTYYTIANSRRKGRDAVVTIWFKIKSLVPDGIQRQEAITRAWNGIGDGAFYTWNP